VRSLASRHESHVEDGQRLDGETDRRANRARAWADRGHPLAVQHLAGTPALSNGLSTRLWDSRVHHGAVETGAGHTWTTRRSRVAVDSGARCGGGESSRDVSRGKEGSVLRRGMRTLPPSGGEGPDEERRAGERQRARTQVRVALFVAHAWRVSRKGRLVMDEEEESAEGEGVAVEV
jgi:hypothetical protein